MLAGVSNAVIHCSKLAVVKNATFRNSIVGGNRWHSLILERGTLWLHHQWNNDTVITFLQQVYKSRSCYVHKLP
jgi:hypothetical protein